MVDGLPGLGSTNEPQRILAKKVRYMRYMRPKLLRNYHSLPSFEYC